MRILSFVCLCCILLGLWSARSATAELNYVSCPLFTDLTPKLLGQSEIPSFISSSSFKNFFGIQNLPVDEKLLSVIKENANAQVQCATPLVPLKYPNSDEKIRLFLKRTHNPDAKKALILLSGGPGGDSSFYESVMAIFMSYSPLVDLYAIEHRGVGRSHRLGCMESQAETKGSLGGVSLLVQEIPECHKEFVENYGDNTDAFSTTQAANDVKFLIEQIKDQYPEGVTLYGLSYGSYWANRVLQLEGAPHGLSKAVLDGIVSPNATEHNPYARTSMSIWDYHMGRAGLAFMDLCDSAELKSSCADIIKKKIDELNNAEHTKFEYKNGREFLSLVFSQVFDHGRCPAWKIPKDQTKGILSMLLQSYKARNLIPALLFRLLRCDETLDHPSLDVFTQYFVQINQAELNRDAPERSSTMLQNNIMFSELWDDSISKEEMTKFSDEAYFSNSIFTLYDSYKLWKKYEDPLSRNNFANLSIPILIMNGDHDSQTPLVFAQTVFDEVSKTCPNAHFFVFKYAPHFSLLFSDYETKEQLPSCGLNILFQFLENGFEKMDKSCLDKLIPPQLGKGDSAESKALFGVSDKWDGVIDTKSGSQTVPLITFIIAQAATVLVSAIIIGILVYAIVRLTDKSSQYDNFLDVEENAN